MSKHWGPACSPLHLVSLFCSLQFKFAVVRNESHSRAIVVKGKEINKSWTVCPSVNEAKQLATLHGATHVFVYCLLVKDRFCPRRSGTFRSLLVYLMGTKGTRVIGWLIWSMAGSSFPACAICWSLCSLHGNNHLALWITGIKDNVQFYCFNRIKIYFTTLFPDVIA